MTAALDAVAPTRWRLADLAKVLVRPIDTMERVLARANRHAIPLLLIAIISGSLRQGSFAALRTTFPWPPHAIGTVAVTLATACLMMLLLVQCFAWLLRLLAPLFEGSGTVADIRAALAWGVAPTIWALLYRLPVALFTDIFIPVRITAGSLALELPNLTAAGWAITIVVAGIDLIVLIWSIALTAATLSVALKLTPWRALGVLAAGLATPFVVLIAAVLAFR